MIHDENKDVRLLSKIAKINQGTKSIIIRRDQMIGNKRWGRIDFLCHYCGYHLVREDGVVANISVNDDREDKRKKDELKKKKSNKRMYA